MRVGISGTQNGATLKQKQVTRQVLKALFSRADVKGLFGAGVAVHSLRHGDCIGYDAQCHQICESIKAQGARINICIHPSTIRAKRAFCKGATSVLAPKPPLERNPDIVDGSDVMVFGPKEYTQQLRSGTWTTYRYAVKKGKKIIVVLPDGELRTEPEGWFKLGQGDDNGSV